MKHSVQSDSCNRKIYMNNLLMFMQTQGLFCKQHMPLGIHKLNIRKCIHYISITSVLLFIYKQIMLNKTMLYNVVFWQSSALTDKILKFNSKLSGCRFWSVSVNSLIIPTRAHWIIVGKNRVILKISLRTMENANITCTSGFWARLFFLFCPHPLPLAPILFVGFLFFVLDTLFSDGLVLGGWFVGGVWFFLNTKGCLSISLWSCKAMNLQIILSCSLVINTLQ